jgi:hypothetical protein
MGGEGQKKSYREAVIEKYIGMTEAHQNRLL